MFLFLFWWCVDDHLAAAIDKPGLGELPIWVPLIISLAFMMTLDGARDKSAKGGRGGPPPVLLGDHCAIWKSIG